MKNEVTFFSSLTDKEPKRISWQKMMELLQGDFLRERTLKYRTLAGQHNLAEASGDKAAADRLKAAMKETKTSCPAVVVQVTIEGGKDKTCIRGYTGYMMADFDHVPPEKLSGALAAVAADPCTFIAYTTISGHGFHVIARVEGDVTEENFRAAWLSVNEYFKGVTGLDYDPLCSNSTRLCGLAWDPAAVCRPDARRIKVNLAPDRKKARKGKGAGRPPKAATLGLRVRKAVEAEGAAYAHGRRNDYVSRCIYLMNRYGVTPEDCTEWALHEFEDYCQRHPKAVESMVHSIYLGKADEHATLAANTGKGKATVDVVENYIREHYVVQRNMLSYNLEYCLRDGSPGSANAPSRAICTVDDHFVNSLWRRMQLDGVSVDVQTINNILGSDFVEDYHPFRQWIENLPPWDGETDHIRQFFSFVHCRDVSDEDYHYYTRCWFLAMVASVMFHEVVNHCILTFIGPQGSFKSSLMLHILPPHLRRYFTTKNNSFQLTKDDYLMLAQNVIISLEEIDSMTTKELNQMKAFTTMPHINERPPYARHTVLMPRVASLTATGNNLTFLTDQTGNRRWLPFHVASIDNPWVADIPYEGMYAQALALIRSGERYWLDDADIRRLNDHNRSFLAPDPARELIVTYYRVPRTEAETKYLTATKIAAQFAPCIKVSPTKVGAAMAELGFEQVRTYKGRFWKVAERPQCEIDSRIPDAEHGENSFDDLPF